MVYRYCGLISGVWAFLGTALVAMFYFPPPRINSNGLSRKETAKQIDYIGGILSISGMLLFMMALQCKQTSLNRPSTRANSAFKGGGYQVSPI
jgi:hypothetical protein